MKVTGIVAEYNPLHNGHLFHISQAKALTCSDYIVVVMSGDFVQRGTPAIINKYERCRTALEAGADLVLEIPVCFSTGSAEFFSSYAVSLLHYIGITDYICFGSECDDVTLLQNAADFFANEKPEYQKALKAYLKQGLAFPHARMRAFSDTNPEHTLPTGSNSTLGIEYLKALKRLGSRITPVVIKRDGTGYDDDRLVSGSYPSALAIRTMLSKLSDSTKALESLKQYVPAGCYNILADSCKKTFPVFENDFSSLMYYSLVSKTASELTKYQDMSEELANRIVKNMSSFYSVSDFADTLKHKQFTHTRIMRSLFHVLLNIHNYPVDVLAPENLYARVLGFNSSSVELMHALKVRSKIPVITKPSSACKQLNETAKKIFLNDCAASDLYSHVIFQKYGTKLSEDITKSVIIK